MLGIPASQAFPHFEALLPWSKLPRVALEQSKEIKNHE